MGAGGSTLTEDRVKSIIEDEVDLSSYAQSSDYTKTSDLKGYLSPNYVDEIDKADPVSTDVNNETKWVTPKYVNTKLATGNVDPSIVARNLATINSFQPVITEALQESGAFQSGVARNLATEGSFQTAIWNQLSSSTPAGTNFRELLINQMKGVSEFKGARGEKGIDGSFNLDSMTKEIWDPQDNSATSTKGWLTMWCADGNICKVPPKRGGIEFTSGEQVIRGFGTDKVVKVDDHLSLKSGGTINLARDKERELTDSAATDSNKLGLNDAKIRAVIQAGNTPQQVNNSVLEIYGVGGLPAGTNSRVPKKVKMYDDVQVTGKFEVIGNTKLNGDKLDFSDWVFHRTGSDVGNELRIAPVDASGNVNWDNGMFLQRDGTLRVKKIVANEVTSHSGKNLTIRNGAGGSYLQLNGPRFDIKYLGDKGDKSIARFFEPEYPDNMIVFKNPNIDGENQYFYYNKSGQFNHYAK